MGPLHSVLLILGIGDAKAHAAVWWCELVRRVCCAGAPSSVEVTECPKHKKNPEVGTKKVLTLNKVRNT
jgi:hypothetical protein